MAKSRHKDPITGDELSQLEYYTRQLQVYARTPWFIIGFNCITVAAIILHHGDDWNYFASWLAIIIEWLVGTYMFGQTARDAIVTRQTRTTSQHVESMEEAQSAMLLRIEQVEAQNHKQLEYIEALLEHAKTGMLPEDIG